MSDFLWQDGKRVDRFHILPSSDRAHSGFWLGDGVFESLLVVNGKVFAKKRHLARYEDALRRVGIQGKDPEPALEAAIEWLDGKIGQVRITQLSSGELLVHAREHVMPKAPISLVLYPHPKNESSVLAGMKTISYGENTAALRFAKEHGSDDVVLINTRGEVSESALSNLLAWDGSEWLTPQLDSGCLPGVTRELLVEFFGVKEMVIMPADLEQMEALAITSSLRDVQAVSKFQDRSYSTLGEVDRLRRAFTSWREQNPNP